MQKILTYVNTGLIILLLAVSVLSGAGHKALLSVSTCNGSITCLYDINVDSTNGIGTATYKVNGFTAIASSSGAGGIDFTGTTIEATTSITDSGTLSVSASSSLLATTTVRGGALVIGASAASAYCIQMFMPGTTTVFYIGISTTSNVGGGSTGGALFVSSTKPTVLQGCN